MVAISDTENIDRRSWDALQTCFSDSIEANFTFVGIREVFRGPATAWIDGMKADNLGMGNTYFFKLAHASGTKLLSAEGGR